MSLTMCLQAVKAVHRQHICTGLSEPSLLAYVISTKFSCAGPYMGLVARKPAFGGGFKQHKSRPACASPQSDKHLCYLLCGSIIC